MRYVERDPKTDKIIATFAVEQFKGQEFLEDDHPDILAAFPPVVLDPKELSLSEKIDAIVARIPAVKQAVDAARAVKRPTPAGTRH